MLTPQLQQMIKAAMQGQASGQPAEAPAKEPVLKLLAVSKVLLDAISLGDATITKAKTIVDDLRAQIETLTDANAKLKKKLDEIETNTKEANDTDTGSNDLSTDVRGN